MPKPKAPIAVPVAFMRAGLTASDIADLVTGPGSATANAIPRFDGTTGKLLKNSLAVLTDDGDLSGLRDLTISRNLSVAGNTTLGDATSDTITATARFASHLIPTAHNTYDLGGGIGVLNWRTGYFATNVRSPQWIHAGQMLITVAANDALRIFTNGFERLRVSGPTVDFHAQPRPSANATFDLGQSGLAWKDGYFTGTVFAGAASFTSLAITGTLTVGGTATFNGNVLLGDAASDTITLTGRIASNGAPSTDNARDWGAAALRWANVYATTFTGALVGNASTATALATARTLWGQSFDGSDDVDGTLTDVENVEASGTVGATVLMHSETLSGEHTVPSGMVAGFFEILDIEGTLNIDGTIVVLS